MKMKISVGEKKKIKIDLQKWGSWKYLRGKNVKNNRENQKEGNGRKRMFYTCVLFIQKTFENEERRKRMFCTLLENIEKENLLHKTKNCWFEFSKRQNENNKNVKKMFFWRKQIFLCICKNHTFLIYLL